MRYMIAIGIFFFVGNLSANQCETSGLDQEIYEIENSELLPEESKQLFLEQANEDKLETVLDCFGRNIQLSKTQVEFAINKLVEKKDMDLLKLEFQITRYKEQLRTERNFTVRQVLESSIRHTEMEKVSLVREYQEMIDALQDSISKS